MICPNNFFELFGSTIIRYGDKNIKRLGERTSNLFRVANAQKEINLAFGKAIISLARMSNMRFTLH